MMTFVNMYSPGLKILATHRVLRNLADFRPRRCWRKRAPVDGRCGRECRSATNTRARFASGWSRPAGRRSGARRAEKANWTCRCCTASPGRLLASAKRPCGTRRYITYVRGIDAAVAEVREKGAQAAFLLEPTPIDDMARIAFAGGVMPQKSTDFYPKLLSGVTIYRLIRQTTLSHFQLAVSPPGAAPPAYL